jgi:signal transduction histidine kinase
VLADRRAAHRARLFAVAAALVVLAWAGLVFVVPQVRFVVVAPKAKTGFEVSLALLRLFTALVLVLFPDEAGRDRLRWVALGFAVLGFGGLGYGYLLPLVRGGDLNAAMYGSLLVRTLGASLMAVGLLPRSAPPLAGRRAVALIGAAVFLGLAETLTVDRLPVLVRIANLEDAAASGTTALKGLSAWHWALSAAPVALAAAAAIGAWRHYPARGPGGWLTVAMVLMAGSQLHTAFWPSAYSSILTTASLLRLAFTVAVAIGAFVELRGVAAERAALLVAERATAARAAELARLRADFTAMVAHELAAPLAAVRHAAELLGTGPMDPTQVRALATIEAEIELLDALLADAQAGATGERADFVVYPFPVELDLILANAVAYARTLPGDHPIVGDLDTRARVLAEPERIAQVLHNLLNNAAKYSPAGAPIILKATRTGSRVRVVVTDRGPGIAPEDLCCVFARYGRGRTVQKEGAPGTGLGLYLARRIVRAHGGDLRVESRPGEGATFWFELQVAP